MLFVERSQIVTRTSFLDRVMALLVCMTIAIAVLYPQSFFSPDSLLGNKWLDPLAAMVAPLVLAGAVCLKVRRKYFRASVVDALVLVFAVYLVAQNVILGPTTLVTLKYVALGLGIYYLTTLLAVKGEPLRKPLLYTVIGLTLLTCAYGLLEYALQKNVIFAALISQSVPEPLHGVHRIGSTLAHPVPFGAFLLQVAPFSGMLLVISRRWWKRLLALLTMSLAVLALFLSYSKGSWMVGGILVAGALLLFPRARSRKAAFPAAIMLVIVIIALAAFWATVTREIDYRSYSSIEGREIAWRAAFAGIEQHPLGVGLFQGSTEMQNQLEPVWRAAWGRMLAVDNYYLDLPLEAGIAGFIIWIAMMIMIFREGISVARIRGPSRPWALMALVGITAICLNAFTVDAFLQWPNYLIFWMTAGILHGIAWSNNTSC